MKLSKFFLQKIFRTLWVQICFSYLSIIEVRIKFISSNNNCTSSIILNYFSKRSLPQYQWRSLGLPLNLQKGPYSRIISLSLGLSTPKFSINFIPWELLKCLFLASQTNKNIIKPHLLINPSKLPFIVFCRLFTRFFQVVNCLS